MPTQRLFDDHGFLLDFEATVLECAPRADRFAVRLDRTAFAPEGGGQGPDRGILDGQTVLDVQEDAQRELWHLVASPIAVGKTVCGKVEEQTRLYHLQNHSGEHILSGLIHRNFGYDNVGFHLGATEVTLDTSGVLSQADLLALETQANRIILEDRPIFTYYPSQKELSELTYRAKLDLTEQVRIVEVEGVDLCACCAPHVNTTGQVGILRILSAMHYKGGMRLRILCGLAALDAWRAQSNQVSAISCALSVPADQIADGVARLQEENVRLKQAASAARDARVKELAQALPTVLQKRVIFTSEADAKGLRDLAQLLLAKGKDAALVISQKADNSFSFVMAVEGNSREIYDGFASAVTAKGGGKPPLFQGSISLTEAELKTRLSENGWV